MSERDAEKARNNDLQIEQAAAPADAQDHPNRTITRNSIDEAKEGRDIVQLKSDHDELGLIKTAWKFRKAVGICTLLCIAAAA